MFHRKILSILCVSGLLLCGLAGCGQTDAVKEAAADTIPSGMTAEAEPAMQTADADGITLQVKTVDGTTITGLVGTLNQPGGPGENGNGPAGGRPPEKPDGQTGAGTGNGTPPDLPEGGMDGKNGPGNRGFTAGTEEATLTLTDATEITKASMGKQETATAADIAVDSILTVTLDENNAALTIRILDGNGMGGPGGSGMPGQGGFGADGTAENGSAAITLSADANLSGETYESAGDDENALRIDGAVVTLTDVTVNKHAGASSNTENGDFYGMNAALLAENGATLTVKNAVVNSSAVNGNGVFAYGSGTTVNISDSTIRTTERNSGGIQTTGGATMNAVNLDIETAGNSAAAIRSDRGGGKVNVDGGVYVTGGTGSPAIYSTADISVKNATLTANASEGVVVEGKNSVALTDCVLSGKMSGTYGGESSENLHAVMLYQSMSGDAEVGHSSFTAEGGSITAESGDMFYVTNTTCTIQLTNVALTLANDTLLNVAGNDGSRGWGEAGKNGGNCTFTCLGQVLTGDILVDDCSALDAVLSENSVLTGSINPSGTTGSVSLTLDAGSAWNLTADSYLTAFSGDTADIVTNGHTVYVNGRTLTK